MRLRLRLLSSRTADTATRQWCHRGDGPAGLERGAGEHSEATRTATLRTMPGGRAGGSTPTTGPVAQPQQSARTAESARTLRPGTGGEHGSRRAGTCQHQAQRQPGAPGRAPSRLTPSQARPAARTAIALTV